MRIWFFGGHKGGMMGSHADLQGCVKLQQLLGSKQFIYLYTLGPNQLHFACIER